jgi:hypothetical protein
MVSRTGVIFEHRSGAYVKYVSTGAQKIALRRPPERLSFQHGFAFMGDKQIMHIRRMIFLIP